MSNVTGKNYIPRKRAEPVVITALTQRRRGKIVRKFLERGTKRRKLDLKDIGESRADNRRYIVTSPRV